MVALQHGEPLLRGLTLSSQLTHLTLLLTRLLLPGEAAAFPLGLRDFQFGRRGLWVIRVTSLGSSESILPPPTPPAVFMGEMRPRDERDRA